MYLLVQKSTFNDDLLLLKLELLEYVKTGEIEVMLKASYGYISRLLKVQHIYQKTFHNEIYFFYFLICCTLIVHYAFHNVK